ncbi:aspartate/glutamate racemase family protein [Paraburkholderia sp. SIMBA_055]|uniref:Allantoin racemase n=1 Tax=Paraburkholderia graminis TaxID=60548 RepID=A0ABD5CNQ6_9BURK|nr:MULTISPECIES: aspartate/glutamate racemase family protein [Paraburkholderia]MDQ0627360.1 allantoin racemase [Paraburkholderia graminis]MDR6205589.1 allantoin racemase [Paraburkholderia graminis]MDR6472464.1 Asp/Glu/hydantoin racemase [Paraburkholderia graminis]MDR6478776.1 Asp/Glu/hydantoin racemase [Paraburkholderia graminis]PTQ91635.1 Asp/Glu/hydantoin racemase [Paraburkholderia sp. GV072]
MNSPIRICVLVPVATSQYNDRIMKAIAPVVPPDVHVEIRNIAEGHPDIENRTNWLQNGMPVVELAQAIANDGFDGIWLTDFDMCGVEAAREVIDIPIIGGFPASAFTALALSQRFSIVTILQSTLAMQRAHPQTYGIEDTFASIRAINCPVAQLEDIDVVIIRTFEAALKAIKEDGAQSILLGCTGFVDVASRVSRMLSDEMGGFVPVIDPNQAGFSFLVSLVRMQLRPSRLTYSKVSLQS